MTLNVSSFSNQQFERRNQLRDTAKYILNKTNANEAEVQSIMQKTILGNNANDYYSNAQLNAIQASIQISLNNSLKETIKYLKNNEKKANKSYKLGDLVNLFDDEFESQEYDGELKDFQIDKNLKNIFAA